MARKSRKGKEVAAPQTIKPSSFRVGAYVRLSVLDRKQKGDSIENQQAIISAYIAAHPDLEPTDVYIDNGLTGQTFERPAFQQMLADLDSEKINCCITKDLSRLGRNSIETGYYIEKYFPTRNIRYIAINDNYDSADGSTSGIMISLKNMINEAYALEIGRKVRATIQMNIKNGGFVGRFAPYGYLKSKSDCHKLVIDEYAAPIVRQIFDMAANGQKVKVIQEWLKDHDILPPRHYLHSIGLSTQKEVNEHTYWHKSAISNILKSRIYVGDMVQGKFRTQSHVRVKIPESEWVITENTHVGIVSREIYEKVQAIFDSGQRSAETKGSDNIFLHKIFCGHCGYSMRLRRHKLSNSYRCDSRVVYSKDACRIVNINENLLKEMLLEALGKQSAAIPIINPPDAIEPVISSDLRNVRAELDRNSSFLKGLYESFIKGDINESEYKEMKKSYSAKIASLSEQENKLCESARLSSLEIMKQNKTADDIGMIRSSADLTAEAIDALIERIDVFEDKRIHVSFKFTDETVWIGGSDNE